MTMIKVEELHGPHINKPVEIHVSSSRDRYCGILLGVEDIDGIDYVEVYLAHNQGRDLRIPRGTLVYVPGAYADGGVVHSRTYPGSIMPCTSEPFTPGMK